MYQDLMTDGLTHNPRTNKTGEKEQDSEKNFWKAYVGCIVHEQTRRFVRDVLPVTSCMYVPVCMHGDE